MSYAPGSPSEIWALDDLPARHDLPRGTGVIYVLEFGNGVIKVGQTADPRRRLAGLMNMAEGLRIGLGRFWVSEAHANHAANERDLLSLLPRSGATMVGEYASGLPFEVVVTLAGKACRSEIGPCT